MSPKLPRRVSEAGQAIVEFALAATVLALMLVAAMFILDVVRMKLATLHAAGEVARMVVNDRCNSTRAISEWETALMDETPLLTVYAFGTTPTAKVEVKPENDPLGLSMRMIATASFQLEPVGLLRQLTADPVFTISSQTTVITKSRSGLIIDREGSGTNC